MIKQPGDHTYTLDLTVMNRPGVLVRCAQIIGRRGHNIEALLVSSMPPRKDRSTMTITAFGKPRAIKQIVAQLNKLIEVEKVTESER